MILYDKPEVRYALVKAYGYKCSICERDIDFKFEVDHIIPKKYKNSKEALELQKILERFELEPGFDIESLKNLRPMHSTCNKKKGADVSEFNYTALKTAKTKLKTVEKYIREYKKHAPEIIRFEALKQSYVEDGINMEELTDRIKGTDKDFGKEEIHGSDYYVINFHTVRINSFLPKFPDLEGSCLFNFRSFYIRESYISLSHKEILDTFSHGIGMPYEMKYRAFISGKVNANLYVIQIGSIRFHLTRKELDDLCYSVDRFMKVYIDSLRVIEKTIECENFLPVTTNPLNYSLIRISYSLWKKIKNFIDEHDFSRGKSEWHIFDSSGTNFIKVFNDGNYECFIQAVNSDAYSLTMINDVNLVWYYINPNFSSDKFDKLKSWTVQKAYDWLVNELIPKVENWDVESVRGSFFNRKKSGNALDYYKKSYVQYHENTPISLAEGIDYLKLLGIVEKLQAYYYVANKYLILDFKVIENLHDLIRYLMECSSQIDYHYIIVKLDFASYQQERYRKGVEFDKQDFLKHFDDVLKDWRKESFNTGWLDNIFRVIVCLTKDSDSSMNNKVLYDYVVNLYPIISEYNDAMLVKKYSEV